MRHRDDLNESGYRAQPLELQRRDAHDHDGQRGAVAGAAKAMPLGKATLSGAYGTSRPALEPVAQLQKTLASAACDATSLEQANRAGDFMRASWAKAALERFIKQAQTLLALVPGGAGGELEQQCQALVERARAALDNAPKISDEARAAADRGDYTQWRTELAAWSAKKHSTSTAADSDAGEEAIANPVEQDTAIAARGTQGSGSPLPHLATIQKAFGRHDVSSVRAHVGGEAAAASKSLGAQAYAFGNAVAFASAPDLHTAAHEAAHVVQQRAGVQLKDGAGAAGDAYERHADAVADRVVAGQSAESLLADAPSGSAAAARTASIQRKEVGKVSEITGPQDWTRRDRETNAARWQAACLYNLQAVDSTQYVKIVERRDFYKWFYEYSVALGYKTRWALAASLVADGAHEIADMDEDHEHANEALDLASVELQGAMREGNQVIFDNVLPKLKKLIENDPNKLIENDSENLIEGDPRDPQPALNWDKQTLSEEQALVQPLYDRMSSTAFNQLNYIARKKRLAGVGAFLTRGDKVDKGAYNNEGRVPAFDRPDMRSVDDRWRYGMDLGNRFTPGGTGFDPAIDKRPRTPIGYRDGAELSKVDGLRHLHQLDAWLNPNRISRAGEGNELQPILDQLTPKEKALVLKDKSADGWMYSTQFGQFVSITEAQVRQALPSEPAAAVNAFISRYAAERKRVEAYLRNFTRPTWL